MTGNHDPHSPTGFPSAPTLRQQLRGLDATSSQEAADLVRDGAQANFTALVWAPLYTFLRSYLRGGLWRHGKAGFVWALFAAYAVFVRSMKVWEQHHVEKPSSQPR